MTIARKALRELDTSRPIMYEGGGKLYEGTGQSELSDIVCPMYYSVNDTVALTKKYKDRPVILCEYSHSMSNSNGNIHLYWKAFRNQKFPRLAGGFIWDMVDQGIRKVHNESGKQYFAYGGDFGDKINDKQFCINGIFDPDRGEHPAVSEIRYVQQPVSIEALRKDAKTILVLAPYEIHIKLKNLFSFRKIDTLDWSWDLTHNMSVQSIFDSDVAMVPTNGLLKIKLSTKMIEMLGKSRLWLNIKCYHRDNTQVIAKEQFELFGESNERNVDDLKPAGFESQLRSSLKVEKAKDSITIFVQSNDYSTHKKKIASFSKLDGQLESYNYTGCDEDEVITAMKPNFTRAVTDNDRGGMDLIFTVLPRWVSLKSKIFGRNWLNYSYFYKWKEIGLSPNSPPQIICRELDVREQCDDYIVIESKCDFVSSTRKLVLFRQHIKYKIFRNRSIYINSEVKPSPNLNKLETIPRIGFTLSLNKHLYNITYLGRGPHENYCDRKSSAFMGIWNQTPNKMAYHYIVPSENGNASDCSWVTLANNEGNGIVIVNGISEGVFSFSVQLHSQKELHNANHTFQLAERQDGESEIYLNLDHWQMGIGGDLSWLPCVYPDYLLKPEGDFISR